MSIETIVFFSIFLSCFCYCQCCKLHRRSLHRYFYHNDRSTNHTSSNDIDISIHSDTTEPCSDISSIN